MKKITDFIVNHRNQILILFIILSGISFYIGTKVTINDDITKYLPKDSETRIGMDIMENDFDEIKSSSLNIMFKGLKSEDTNKIKEELENISGVSNIEYDETEEYNKDGYTLYIVSIDDTSDSKLATQVYQKIEDKYKDYDVFLSGSIVDANKPVLDIWIMVLAVVCAMIILIIMCESYIEPFLFLFTIGLGIFFNMGTNIIFASVSNITNSIAAILQMALSMDYSIMLMNRYSQEKEHKKDKVKAMKDALYNAFLSISSSSVTTIVGLLALVFMSFTIGRDLGFVLAKGVLFSLICIFTCLPGLILLFDNLITKTKKKPLSIKLDFLGKFSFKVRYIMSALFVILFIASYILKGNLNILYTDSEMDKVNSVFRENNQIAIIYNNQYEETISNYCQKIDKKDKVDTVLCYGNTINQKLTYQELNEKLNDLGADTNIDDYLLKIIYYNYYNKKNNTKLSFNEFISFINKEIRNSKDMKDKIDKDTLANIDKLNNFATKNNVNKKRSKKELANILGISSSDLDSLLIYYNSKNISTKISITDFIKFINKDVLTDKNYSSSISSDAKKQIESLTIFTDKNTINKKMTKEELNQLFGIDLKTLEQLMLLYSMSNESKTAITLNEFIIMVDNINKNTDYLKNVDVSGITNLVSLAKNENNINDTKMNKAMLNQIFSSVVPNLVETVYTGANLPDAYTMSPKEFIDFVLTNFANYLKSEEITQLNILSDILNNSKKQYMASEMALLLGQDKNNIIKIYALIDYVNNKTVKMTPYELTSLIVNTKEIASSIDAEMLKTLKLLTTIMTSVNNNTKYTANFLAQVLGMNESDMKLLYSLYSYKYLNNNIKVSLKDFISFMVSDVINNKQFSSKFDSKTKEKLTNINEIIKGTIKGTKYSDAEIFALLSKLSDDIDKNLVELVYIYYGSHNKYDASWTLTVEEIINYLNDDILNDKRFNDFIDGNLKDKIVDAKDLISDAKNMLISKNYSRMIINTKFAPEDKETFDFIQSIKDDLNSEGKEIYVIGDSPMAYEMSKSFDDELNLITLITMIAIFIVVAISFKSLIVPLILVLIIQCAVFFTMGILSLLGGNVYFIALLIVQSILMGATIDYAIVFTSYYRESRSKNDIKESLINAYNNSIHTILTSASVLIIVTLIVGNFASAIAAKICKTISQGTFCSVILILFVLPSLLALFDRLICKDQYKNQKNI